MIDKYIDHKLGSQKDKTTSEDVNLTKRILDGYIEEQSIEDVRENQRIGIKLEMKSCSDGNGDYSNLI